MSTPSCRLAVVALALSLLSVPAEAQLLDDLKKKLSDAKGSVSEVKGSMADARAIRCEAQGVCGEVWASDQFSPGAYETLAVAVSDATRRYGSEAMQGAARDPFEGTLVQNGYLLAGSTETEALQQRIGGGKEEWTDERLGQLRDFVADIDAVLLIDIRELEMSTCRLEKNNRPVRATAVRVSLSARWLNVDVGDVPWVARHTVSSCEDGGREALTTALETAARQLATNLPMREAS